MAWTRTEKVTLWAAIISSPLLTLVIDFFKEKPIFSTLWSWIIWLWNGLFRIMTYETAIWIVLLIVVGLFGLLVLISKLQEEPMPRSIITKILRTHWAK